MFFVLAITVFGCYQALPQTPNLSLIFDSQGYLAVANACQKLFSMEFLGTVFQYAAGGFKESQRLFVLNKLGGAFDLAFSGPVVPFLLAGVYNLFGKQAITQNWLIGANAMLVVSALIVPLIWMTARLFWGQTQARLAGLLSLAYPALAINSWRILGDVTTCLGSALLLALLAHLVVHRNSGIKSLLWGLATGAVIVFLMLGKAPLMPLPWLLLAEIFVLSVLLKEPLVFNMRYALGILIGCAIAIAPWMMLKQIITGQPSIVVDRGGAYNLYVGCNLQADGWDVLPSRYVTHPKEFTKTSAEVREEIVATLKKNPWSFIDLMARKPARLMSAPWNDFQNSFFGMSWGFQKWWQEVILLLASAGALISLRVAVVRRDFQEVAPIIILSTFVMYFLVYAPVISMSRYFYPAVPALLLLAAQGIFWLATQWKKTAFQLLAVTTLLVPTMLCLLDPSWIVNAGFLGKQVASYGVGNVALLGSTAIVIGLSLWFWIATLATGKVAKLELFKVVLEHRGKGYFLLWLVARCAPLVVFVGALVCASASARQELFCLEWSKQLTGRKSVETKVFVPRQAVPRSWFLVIDSIGVETKGKEERSPCLDIWVNGNHLKDKLRPLWALDCSQRDNLVYLRAFAYGQGRNVEDIRQWWCVNVPAQLIKQNSNNEVAMSAYCPSGQERPLVFGDFVTPEGEPGGHVLSLRNFSWCKGFFADCVGEMRMDFINRPHGLTNIWFQQPKIRPRIRLIAVADRPDAPKFAPVDFFIGDATLGPGKAALVVDTAVPDNLLAVINKQVGQSAGPVAACIQVSANYKCAKGKSGKASICFVHNLDDVPDEMAALQFAPQAPGILEAGANWRTVSFEDILPLSMENGKQPAKLAKVRVLLAGVPWWDMLSYGRFKTKTAIDFQNLSLHLMPLRVFNLDQQDFEEYQSQVLN